MIVAPLRAELLVVTQGDHAHLAGEMLSLMRLPELVGHPRRELLLQAVREHDNGWREVDAAPRVDLETGMPIGFRDIDAGTRRRLWRRGAERWRDREPYVALLVTLHAIALNADRRPDEDWTDWLASLDELAGELAVECDIDVATAERDHEWLALADACSLAVCERRSTRFERLGLRAHLEADSLALEPFPLAGATTFEVSCRRIERHRYRSDRELGVALARARWETRPVRLEPA